MLTLQSNNTISYMKPFILTIFLFLLLTSCNSDNNDASCVSRQLPNYGFDVTLNLTFFNNLQFANNAEYISGYGVKGFYLYNTGLTNTNGGNLIVALEASDPAHAPSSCSQMTMSIPFLSCECGDGNKYQMLTGQQTEGTGGHCLRSYRVDDLGNNMIRVYN